MCVYSFCAATRVSPRRSYYGPNLSVLPVYMRRKASATDTVVPNSVPYLTCHPSIPRTSILWNLLQRGVCSWVGMWAPSIAMSKGCTTLESYAEHDHLTLRRHYARVCRTVVVTQNVSEQQVTGSVEVSICITVVACLCRCRIGPC